MAVAALLGGALGLALASPGCNLCSLDSCRPGFALEVGGAGAPLDAATYEITVRPEGELYRFSCRPGPPDGWVCDDPEQTGAFTVMPWTFGVGDDTAFRIELWRADNDDQFGPTDVEFEIDRGDVGVFKAVYDPVYTRETVNCAQCDQRVTQRAEIEPPT